MPKHPGGCPRVAAGQSRDLGDPGPSPPSRRSVPESWCLTTAPADDVSDCPLPALPPAEAGRLPDTASVHRSSGLTSFAAHPPSLQSNDFREIRLDKRLTGNEATGRPVAGHRSTSPPAGVRPAGLSTSWARFPPGGGTEVPQPGGPLPALPRAPDPRLPSPPGTEVPDCADGRVPAGPLDPLRLDCAGRWAGKPARRGRCILTARPHQRPLDPVAALLHSRAVVAVTEGHGASLTTPPGCRHRQRAEARSWCRASSGPMGQRLVGWPGVPAMPKHRLPRRRRSAACCQSTEPLVHVPDRRQPRPASPEKSIAGSSPSRPVPPSRLIIEYSRGTEVAATVPLVLLGDRGPREAPASVAGWCRCLPSPLRSGRSRLATRTSVRDSCHGRPRDQAVCGRWS
jgi:hypothetical protein